MFWFHKRKAQTNHAVIDFALYEVYKVSVPVP
jgi:hypothetical protein